jgi:hypothetical protein
MRAVDTLARLERAPESRAQRRGIEAQQRTRRRR